jgi:YfiH family protein
VPETGPEHLTGIVQRRRLPVWAPQEFARPPHLQMLVTTRRGGVSAAPWDSLNLSVATGDAPDAVDDNRHRLRQDTGMPAPAWLHQVHGDRVVAAADLAAFPAGSLQADGMWTQERGVALVIGIADCVPIFLWDATGARIALVHAGWRGTAQRIVQRAIALLLRAGARLEEMMLALGPCIGVCCYQVGLEVAQQLPAAAIQHDRRGMHADLRLANRILALDSGLSPQHIESAPPCTACHTDWFFSHRRQGPATGRMWAVAWMEEPRR